MLEQIEKRFCETTKLGIINLTKFPIQKSDYREQKQETIKELSDKYGFVPTPIFLVDTMIVMEQKNITKDSVTCDFCAGCGQYTVRLLRYLKNKFDIDIEQFLTNNHYLTELQPENCAALVYIFGPNINLYVGDSMNLKYSTEDDKGILFFKKDKWEYNDVVNKLILEYKDDREALSIIFKNSDKSYRTIKSLIEDYLEDKKKQEENKVINEDIKSTIPVTSEKQTEEKQNSQ